MMAPWIEEKAEYIRRDFLLAQLAPARLTLDDLHAIMGKKDIYSMDDAKLLQKKQYSAEKYREMMDKVEGYSEGRMLAILKERCKYVIERGATLNNPHIPGSYFDGWEKIESNHAARLRELIMA